MGGAMAAVAVAAAAATGAPGAAQAIVDVGLRKEYVDPSEFFRIEYPIGTFWCVVDAPSVPLTVND